CTGGPGGGPMTSLVRERNAPLRPALVRERLLEHFTRRFPCARGSLFFSHPSLGRKAPTDAVAAHPLARPTLRVPSPPPPAPPARPRLPAWLKRQLPRGNGNFFTEGLLRELRLETVCENARCPNRPECYARRTATFMILGNVCTRPCGFCSVPRGAPEALED